MLRRCAVYLGVVGLLVPGVGAVSALAVSQVVWTQVLTTTSMLDSYNVAMDSAGNVYVAGQTSGNAIGTGQAQVINGYVAKFAQNGSLLWDHVWNNAAGYPGVAVDNAGSVFVSDGYNVKKYNSCGTLLWKALLPSNNIAKGVAVDPIGNAYVTGGSFENGSGHWEPFVSKISSSGSITWTTIVNTPTSGEGSSIAVDPSGNAVIAGSYDNADGVDSTGFATKFDSTGHIGWYPTYSLLGDNTYAGCVAVDEAGATYVTMAVGTQSGYLMKYDTSNNLQWFDLFGYNGGPVSLALDPAGSEYVVGGNGILRFDSSGSFVDSLPWAGWQCLYLAFGGERLSVAGFSFRDGYQSAYVSNVVIPEPPTLALLAAAATSLFVLVHFRRAWAHSSSPSTGA